MRTFQPPGVPPAAKTLERDWYVSPEIFVREQAAVFSREWIAVGRASQIGKPGDFFTAEIAGESLIVTRGKAGAIHAFYNVCRHRGTRLCSQQSGQFKNSIQCPYHAWTYGLDGELCAARNMDGVTGFDRADYALHRAHTGVFDGFIFAALDPVRPFETWIAPLRERFAEWSAGALVLGNRIDYEIRANWKLIFQNYSECYHCPVIHPQLEKLSPSDSGRNDLSEGPFLGGYSTLREGGRTLTGDGQSSRAPLPGVRGENLSRVYYYTLFPSLLLSLHPDYVMAHYVRAAAADRTLVTCEWYFDSSEAAAPGFDPSDAVGFWDLTNRQDWNVSALTQQGVSSRSYVPGPYSNQEGLLHAFDSYYRSAMDA